jgi:DNA-binding transcriptional regulator YiaG
MTRNMLASPRTLLQVAAHIWLRVRSHNYGRPGALLQNAAENRISQSHVMMPTDSRANSLIGAVARPGTIGGAVIKAARRSARLSRGQLARTVGVGVPTVCAWETGSVPLYCVPYDLLLNLSQALERTRAQGASFAELLLASQCDLLMAAALAGTEDYAEVPPLDSDTDGQNTRDLLRWALTGTVPEPYRPYAPRHRLLTKEDALRFLAVAEGLTRGEQGAALAAVGAGLLALADRQPTSPDGTAPNRNRAGAAAIRPADQLGLEPVQVGSGTLSWAASTGSASRLQVRSKARRARRSRGTLRESHSNGAMNREAAPAASSPRQATIATTNPWKESPWTSTRSPAEPANYPTGSQPAWTGRR